MTNSLPLGEVAEFIRGITFKPSDIVDFGTPDSSVCMRTKNVQADIDQNDLISIPDSFIKKDFKFLREGDLLVSTANSWNLVGKACWVPSLGYSATAGGFISILRALPNKVDNRYLYHWMVSGRTQHTLRHCGRQTTNISNMDIGRALEIQIPVPPIKEQKRIAAILDKADAIRRKRQQAIELADQFLRSVFLDMFGEPRDEWSEIKFVEITTGEKSTFVNGPFGSNLLTSELVSSGVPVLYVQDLRNGRFYRRSSRYVTQEKAQQLSMCDVHSGDILIAKVGDPPGWAAVYPEGADDAIVTQDVIRIRPDLSKITPEFIASFLNGPLGRRWLRPIIVEATRSRFGLGEIKKMDFLLPPLKLQREYSEICNHVFNQRERKMASSRQLDNLFNCISQRAFNGELTASRAA